MDGESGPKKRTFCRTFAVVRSDEGRAAMLQRKITAASVIIKDCGLATLLSSY